jgi:hypothetical protein
LKVAPSLETSATRRQPTIAPPGSSCSKPELVIATSFAGADVATITRAIAERTMNEMPDLRVC